MEPRQHPVVNQQTQIVHPLRPEEEERSSGFARFVNFVPYYFRKFFTSGMCLLFVCIAQKAESKKLFSLRAP
jgi:hypothetical protein